MTLHYGFSEARSKMSELVDRVQAGDIAVIDRRGTRVMVTTLDDVAEILAHCYSFSPQVYPNEDGSVAIWLAELAVHGEGASLEEAEEDLVEAVQEYLEDWEQYLRHAPDAVERKGWVRRLELAESASELRSILFSP